MAPQPDEIRPVGPLMRFLEGVQQVSARLPLAVAAVAGGWLAWPLGPRAGLGARGAVAGAALLLCLAEVPGLATRALRRAAATAATLALGALAIAQRPEEPLAGLAVLIGGTLVLHRVWFGPLLPAEPGGPRRPARSVAPWLALVAVLVPRAAGPSRAVFAGFFATLVALDLVTTRLPRSWSPGALFDALLASPARLLVASFGALSATGGLLLALPLSDARGAVSAVDALFTAVSATCVTGLIVRDTPHDFTGFGQLVILLLIQFGGLGIMTFAAAATLLLGRRLRVRAESAAAAMMGHESARRDLESAVITVLRVTFLAEFAGAALLFPRFLAHGDGPGLAAWRAVFTSVSAFCNAGFALQSDSLVPYREDAAVLLVTGALIVVGGLGPAVVAALAARRRLDLHAKLVISTTSLLLVLPTALFLAVEWNNTLAGLEPLDRLVNAWFQAVTFRTAGFNSVDFAAIRPATWTLGILLMFIGGSPGSTAGGAKTTTMAVLALAVVATIRGHREVQVFGRRVPHRTIYEATAIATGFVLSSVLALAGMQLTGQADTVPALFEVISALGTVGLSMGTTAKLDVIGKLLIMGCMFAGRVGPLTLFIVLVGRDRPGRRYPLESVQVG